MMSKTKILVTRGGSEGLFCFTGHMPIGILEDVTHIDYFRETERNYAKQGYQRQRPEKDIKEFVKVTHREERYACFDGILLNDRNKTVAIKKVKGIKDVFEITLDNSTVLEVVDGQKRVKGLSRLYSDDTEAHSDSTVPFVFCQIDKTLEETVFLMCHMYAMKISSFLIGSVLYKQWVRNPGYGLKLNADQKSQALGAGIIGNLNTIDISPYNDIFKTDQNKSYKPTEIKKDPEKKFKRKLAAGSFLDCFRKAKISQYYYANFFDIDETAPSKVEKISKDFMQFAIALKHLTLPMWNNEEILPQQYAFFSNVGAGMMPFVFRYLIQDMKESGLKFTKDNFVLYLRHVNLLKPPYSKWYTNPGYEKAIERGEAVRKENTMAHFQAKGGDQGKSIAKRMIEEMKKNMKISSERKVAK